jgi:hypothetical protein
MARGASGVLHALLLLAAAGCGVQATPVFNCVNSLNPTACSALLDLYNAFGGATFFGAGYWFDQPNDFFIPLTTGTVQPVKWPGVYTNNAPTPIVEELCASQLASLPATCT